MKKKLVFIALVVCLAASVAALAACNDLKSNATCTLSGRWLDGVMQVEFADVDGGVYGFLDEKQTETTDLPKDLVNVRVYVDPYSVQDLHVFINNTEMPLGLLHGDYPKYYEFTYQITKDFTISFSGTAPETDGLLTVDVAPEEFWQEGVVHISEGLTISLDVVIHLENHHYGSLDQVITVASDNPDSVFVESDPHMMGENNISFWAYIGSAGTAHVTVSTPKQSKTVTFVVDPLPPVEVHSLSLSKNYMHLYTGWENFNTTIDVSIGCDSDRDGARALKFSVDDDSIVDVQKENYSYDPDSKISRNVVTLTPKKAGTTVVTLTAGEKTATITVVVEEKPQEVTGSAGLEFDNRYDRWYVTGWGTCDAEEIVIPNVYNGERVYGVEMDISDQDQFTAPRRIVVSEGVESLENAFYGCVNVTSITLPASLSYIGGYVFADCESLAEITIPDGVSQIGTCAFRNCHLLGSVTLPDSVMSLKTAVFEGCDSLTSVKLPAYLEELPGQTFADCSRLTTVTIPDSVKEIGYSAFSGCNRLEKVNLPSGITEIPGYLFGDCSSLHTVVIPDGVTSIGNSAFARCASLNEINIPQSVTSIGDYAFGGCHLSEIYLSDSVQYGDGVYVDNQTLSSIHVKDVSELLDKWHVFMYFGNYPSFAQNYKIYLGADNTPLSGAVTISGAETVPAFFLYSYNDITEATFEGIDVIADNAFLACRQLAKVVLNDVREIRRNAFAACDGLVKLYISDKLESIGEACFNKELNNESIGVYFDDFATWFGIEGLLVLEGSELYLNDVLLQGTVTVPSGTTKIPEYAFEGNRQITEFILEAGIEEIGDFAFYGCTQLNSITLPGTLVSIAPDALSQCGELTTINCPDTVDLSNLTLDGCNKFRGMLSDDGRYYTFGGKVRSLADGQTYFVVPQNVQFEPYAFHSVRDTLKYIYTEDANVLQGVEFDSSSALRLVIYKSGQPGSNIPADTERSYGACTPDGWVYEQDQGSIPKVTILCYIGNTDDDGNVNVPATINGVNVTNLSYLNNDDHGCFLSDYSIRKITFESRDITVTSISFLGLTNLQEVALTGERFVVMPYNTSKPVSQTFASCTQLEKISLPENYTFSASYQSEAYGTSTPLPGTDLLVVLQNAPNAYLFIVTINKPAKPIQTVVGQTFVFRTARTDALVYQQALGQIIDGYMGTVLTFGSDGSTGTLSGGMMAQGADSPFTYTVDGNNISITMESGDQKVTLELTIEGSELIMNMPSMPVYIVFVLQ